MVLLLLLVLLGEHVDEEAGVLVVVGVGVGVLEPVLDMSNDELFVSGKLSRLERWWMSC